MNFVSNIFNKFVPDFNKLVEYGFVKDNNGYTYEKFFKNSEFKTVVKIDRNGIISAKVFEVETDDEYLPLRIKSQEGVFTGTIREEYKIILTEIRDNCFSKKYFISNQANRITNLIISKYGNYPCFMWEQSPDCGVFKNPDNNKWYGIIMNIDYSKLGAASKKNVEILNIKLDKDKIPTLLKQKGFFPAWHMNKKYWISIALDDTLADEQIFNLVTESHACTEKK